MPFLLRKIRKSRWYNESPPWLSPSEIQADPLGDLSTSDNALSVWLVEADLSNLEHVVTALASGCDSVSNVDYALLDLGRVTGLSISIEDIKGGSPYQSANHWHRDLTKLSGEKVLSLAKAMHAHAKRDRCPEKQVLKLLKQAFEAGQLDRNGMKPSLLEKINRRVAGAERSEAPDGA